MFRITEDPSSGSINPDLVHVNGQDRIILVIFSQALYKAL